MTTRTGNFDEDARMSFQGIANATGKSRYLVILKAAELIANREIRPPDRGKISLRDARIIADALTVAQDSLAA